MSSMVRAKSPADPRGSALAEYLQLGRRDNLLRRAAGSPTAEHDGTDGGSEPDTAAALEEGS